MTSFFLEDLDVLDILEALEHLLPKQTNSGSTESVGPLMFCSPPGAYFIALALPMQEFGIWIWSISQIVGAMSTMLVGSEVSP